MKPCCVGTAVLLLLGPWLTAGSGRGLPLGGDSPAAEVTVTIKVYDQAGKVIVDAGKKAAKHSNAFDVVRGTLQVEFTTYAGLGAFVTGIAGVKPPANAYWALYTDGQYSQLGISNITVEKDLLIEWKMTDMQSQPEHGQRVLVTAKVLDKEGKKVRDHVFDYTVHRPDKAKP